ncbi:hypothetical protein F4774DRAFT_5710 [Daldinia eschscholtzii]|nr:hypothetical protein F4774DRAFT_5710 [Daldinia eschscholtzii]
MAQPTPELPPTSFPWFRLLPVELQGKIWRAAIPGQQLIQSPQLSGSKHLQLRMPAIAHVCRESRHVYLLKEGKNMVRTPDGKLFNPKKDIVAMRIALLKFEGMKDIEPHLESIILVGNDTVLHNYGPIHESLPPIIALFVTVFLGFHRIRTINIFPNGGKDMDSFFVNCHPGQLNDRAARLFGNDSLVVANMQNEDECNSLLASLDTCEGASKCATSLREVYEPFVKDKFEAWTFTMLLLTQTWVKMWNSLHGLPDCRPIGADMSFADELAYIQKDPTSQQALENMPKINLVLLAGLKGGYQ